MFPARCVTPCRWGETLSSPRIGRKNRGTEAPPTLNWRQSSPSAFFNVGGALAPRLLPRLIEEPRPWFCHQFGTMGTAGLPLLWFLDQISSDWVLLNVILHIRELLGSTDPGIIVGILPVSAVRVHDWGRPRSDEAHHRMHEARERPRIPQGEQSVPVIRHNDKRPQVDAFLFQCEFKR